MDLKAEFEQLKQQLLSLGFDNQKLDELLMLATEEVIDVAMDDLEASENDEALEKLATLMQTPTNNEQEALEKISKVFEAAYGAEADTKKLTLLNQYLKDTIKLTEAAKDLGARYQAGDPTAVAAVQTQMGNPEVQKIQDAI